MNSELADGRLRAFSGFPQLHSFTGRLEQLADYRRASRQTTYRPPLPTDWDEFVCAEDTHEVKELWL
jgi:hypothetical protein